jgi:hypothetical protein
VIWHPSVDRIMMRCREDEGDRRTEMRSPSPKSTFVIMMTVVVLTVARKTSRLGFVAVIVMMMMTTEGSVQGTNGAYCARNGKSAT